MIENIEFVVNIVTLSFKTVLISYFIMIYLFLANRVRITP